MCKEFHSKYFAVEFLFVIVILGHTNNGKNKKQRKVLKRGFRMATDILISIKNLQEQDGERNVIDYQTKGELYEKKGTTYLRYKEKGEGLEGVQTTLKVEKEQISLIRHGALSMCQVFKEGVRNDCEYNTPHGTLMLSTDTKNMEKALGFDDGRIRISYDLYFSGQLTSNNTLEIEYKTIQ